MRMITLLLLINISVVTSAPIDTCFTPNQIKNIYYKIKIEETRNRISDSIIIEQDNQIQDLRGLIKNDSLVILNKNNQINLLNEKNTDLNKMVDILKPKWHDDKTLWFGLGVILTIIGFSF